MARSAIILTLIALTLGIGSPALAKEKKLPDTSHDGLTLQKDTKLDAVYLRDGADLSQYTKVAMEMPQVAFRKNWQRDHNAGERELSRRISDDEMDKLKKKFADEFIKIFVDELRKAGHEVTKDFADDVLLLAPALVEIDITAPSSNQTTGINRTYAANPGQMSLYMELYDSVSGQIIARVLDTKGGRNMPAFQVTTKGSNTAAVDRALRAWAGILIDNLGEVKPPASDGDGDSSAGH